MEQVKYIGTKRPWMDKYTKPVKHNFIKKVYCSNCGQSHEEGKHREGVK